MDSFCAKYNLHNLSKISKGMSSDEKYKAEDVNGKHYLIRIADISELEEKKAEFKRMKVWNEAGIPMPQAIDLSIGNDGKSVDTLLEWVEGEEVQEVLKKMDDAKRYHLGVESGRILRKIHNATELNTNGQWYERYFGIIDERLQAFLSEDVSFEGDRLILDYLNSNRELVKNRPQCCLHGDYHMGNMILTPESHIKVIDWHTVDFDNYGDPWYEFNRIGLEYPSFASGQIDGYFDGNVPDDFWKMLLYYLSASAITSVVWAKYWAPKEFGNIINMNQGIIKDFNGFMSLRPKWYRVGGLHGENQ